MRLRISANNPFHGELLIRQISVGSSFREAQAVPAKLDELHLRNTTELWADDAESRNGRRLPHNSCYMGNSGF